jgi:hypothetical protein
MIKIIQKVNSDNNLKMEWREYTPTLHRVIHCYEAPITSVGMNTISCNTIGAVELWLSFFFRVEVSFCKLSL